MRVTVEDSGVGLSAEEATRVFERFLTTKREGLGMGLAISRSIVEARGGRLWADTPAGGGTAFQFTLPAADTQAA